QCGGGEGEHGGEECERGGGEEEFSFHRAAFRRACRWMRVSAVTYTASRWHSSRHSANAAGSESSSVSRVTSSAVSRDSAHVIWRLRAVAETTSETRVPGAAPVSNAVCARPHQLAVPITATSALSSIADGNRTARCRGSGRELRSRRRVAVEVLIQVLLIR